MDYTIYSIGDSQFLWEVLNSVAMFFSSDSFGDIIKLALALGVIGTLFKGLLEGAKSIEIQHFIIGIIFYGVFFAPKVDEVKIENVYTGSVVVVDNVPLGIAFTGSLISQMGYGLMTLFEVSYSDIDSTDSPQLSKQGFTESLKILTDLRRNSSDLRLWEAMDESTGKPGASFYYTWYDYISNCTFSKISQTDFSASDVLNNSINDALYFPSNNSFFKSYLEGSTPEMTPCSSGYEALQEATQTALSSESAEKAIASLVKIHSGQTSSTPNELLNDALALTTKSTISAQEYVKISILEPVLQKASENAYSSMLHDSAAIMVNQAIQQRNTQWATQQTLFQSIMKPVIAYMEGFVFAITPFMAFAVCLGRAGVMVGMKYFYILLWVTIWYPLLSVTNMYISIAANRDMTLFADVPSFTWDSFYAINSAADVSSEWVATGGMMAASIPLLAIAVLTGGITALSGIANRLGGSEHINNQYSTPDASTTPSLVNNMSGYSATASTLAARGGASTFDSTIGLSNLMSTATTGATQLSTQALAAVSASTTRGISHIASSGNGSDTQTSFESSMRSSNDQNLRRVHDFAKDNSTDYSNALDFVKTFQGALEGSLSGNLKGAAKTEGGGLAIGVGAGLTGSSASIERSGDGESFKIKLGDNESFTLSKGQASSFIKSLGIATSKALSQSDSTSNQANDLDQALTNYSDQQSKVASYTEQSSNQNQATLSKQIDLKEAVQQLGSDSNRSFLDSQFKMVASQVKDPEQFEKAYKQNFDLSKNHIFGANDSANDIWAKLKTLNDFSYTEPLAAPALLDTLSNGGLIPSAPRNEAKSIEQSKRENQSAAALNPGDATNRANDVSDRSEQRRKDIDDSIPKDQAAFRKQGDGLVTLRNTADTTGITTAAAAEHGAVSYQQFLKQGSELVKQDTDKPLFALGTAAKADVVDKSLALAQEWSESKTQQWDDVKTSAILAARELNKLDMNNPADAQKIAEIKANYAEASTALGITNGLIYMNNGEISRPEWMSVEDFGNVMSSMIAADKVAAEKAHETRMSDFQNTDSPAIRQELSQDSGRDEQLSGAFVVGSIFGKSDLLSDFWKDTGSGLAKASGPLGLIASSQINHQDVADFGGTNATKMSLETLSDLGLDRFSISPDGNKYSTTEIDMLNQAKLYFAPAADKTTETSRDHEGNITYTASSDSGQTLYTYTSNPEGKVLSVQFADQNQDDIATKMVSYEVTRGAYGDSGSRLPLAPKYESAIEQFEKSKKPFE